MILFAGYFFKLVRAVEYGLALTLVIGGGVAVELYLGVELVDPFLILDVELHRCLFVEKQDSNH